MHYTKYPARLYYDFRPTLYINCNTLIRYSSIAVTSNYSNVNKIISHRLLSDTQQRTFVSHHPFSLRSSKASNNERRIIRNGLVHATNATVANNGREKRNNASMALVSPTDCHGSTSELFARINDSLHFHVLLPSK